MADGSWYRRTLPQTRQSPRRPGFPERTWFRRPEAGRTGCPERTWFRRPHPGRPGCPGTGRPGSPGTGRPRANRM